MTTALPPPLDEGDGAFAVLHCPGKCGRFVGALTEKNNRLYTDGGFELIRTPSGDYYVPGMWCLDHLDLFDPPHLVDQAVPGYGERWVVRRYRTVDRKLVDRALRSWHTGRGATRIPTRLATIENPIDRTHDGTEAPFIEMHRP